MAEQRRFLPLPPSLSNELKAEFLLAPAVTVTPTFLPVAPPRRIKPTTVKAPPFVRRAHGDGRRWKGDWLFQVSTFAGQKFDFYLGAKLMLRTIIWLTFCCTLQEVSARGPPCMTFAKLSPSWSTKCCSCCCLPTTSTSTSQQHSCNLGMVI